jgi:osomolarity two-component system sensor histidine kinase SLN1
MSRNRGHLGSGSNTSQASRGASSSANVPKPAGTALLINPMDPNATPHVQVREQSPTPPPASAKTLMFEFEVEDTGPGIPEHLQQRVFEPFVQGDLGLSKKYGGTGLGLSICSQLASLMGGSITLESTLGVGTRFNMRIPLKFVKERAPSTSSSDAHASRPASIYSPGDDRAAVSRVPRDISPTGAAGKTNNPMGFKKDPQPRLVGLSQPFFAATPTSPTVKGPKEQLAALDRVAASKDAATKIRVLVAEDNLVNQEVVLR